MFLLANWRFNKRKCEKQKDAYKQKKELYHV